jgi:hypothetical protein
MVGSLPAKDRYYNNTSAGAAVKVTLTANPNFISADGESISCITAYLKDTNNNTDVTITRGIFNFGVSGAGSLWLDADNPGSSRGVQQQGGETYILLKAGTTKGQAVVTASFGTLTPGSVTVPVGEGVKINVKVSPNPFVPGSASNTLKFANLSSNSTVKIYTLSGKLVSKLNEADFGGGEIRWNVKNNKGKSIAPGLYIYLVTDTHGNEKTGKLVISK